MSDLIHRPLPALTALTRPFWTGGSTGQLHVQRCNRCRRFIHPPTLLCPRDHSAELTFVPVSGRGTIETWTVNEHNWFDWFPAPYVIAYVALDEDPSTRILTNILNIEPSDLRIGLPVQVAFESHVDGEDQIHLPVFEPVRD